VAKKKTDVAVDESLDGLDYFSSVVKQSSDFSDLLDKIKKKHGDQILTQASDKRVAAVQRLPSGIFPLDYALSGGFPVGRFNLLYGMQSSTKTSTLLRTIGNAQKLCGICYTDASKAPEISCVCGANKKILTAFVDTEGAFDRNWSESLGVSLDALLLSQPDNAEQAIDIADSLLRSGKIDILAIDSLAFLIPTKEIENSAEQATMALQAQLIGKAIRKFTSALNDLGNTSGHRPTVFLTNQIRQKLTMFGDPNTVPGGMAPGFAASTIVKFKPGKIELNEETSRPLNTEISFVI